MLLNRIEKEIPLQIYRFPSGQTYNGWTVPEHWEVKTASIFLDGEEVFDATRNPLGVAWYSNSFSGELSYEELLKHLVTKPELPEAYVYHCMWQYRPWEADWALSIPFKKLQELPRDRRYFVDLKTTKSPGEMLVGEFFHQGESEECIVLNCHTCHPKMANDAFCGLAILVSLMKALRGKTTRYSYKLVIGPEHLGTVFYLRDCSLRDVERMVSGIYAEMPGTNGPIRVASTFRGNQKIDLAFRNACREYSTEAIHVPWRHGAGNDETVWESPGNEVPFVEVTRCEEPDHPYREYHTDLDNADLMDPNQVKEFQKILCKVIEILEEDKVPKRKFNGLICLSNPDYDLYFERYDPAVEKDLDEDSEKWGRLLDSLFRYLDGEMSVLEIAELHELPFDKLLEYLEKFEAKELLEFTPAKIERKSPKRF
jgi:aminopeptidase-like protein